MNKYVLLFSMAIQGRSAIEGLLDRVSSSRARVSFLFKVSDDEITTLSPAEVNFGIRFAVRSEGRKYLESNATGRFVATMSVEELGDIKTPSKHILCLEMNNRSPR